MVLLDKINHFLSLALTSTLVRYSTSLRRLGSLAIWLKAWGCRRSQEAKLSSWRHGHVWVITSKHASVRKWQHDSSKHTRLTPQAFIKLEDKRQRWSDYYHTFCRSNILNIWIRDSCHYLQNPAAVTAPRLPVQDMFSLCRRLQRLCRWLKEASVSQAQYGCRLSWMYCNGSQQCLWKSLQLWANRHRSGTGRWLTISWISYSEKQAVTFRPKHSKVNVLLANQNSFLQRQRY